MLPIWLYWDKPETCPNLIRIFHKLVLLNNTGLDVRILDEESVKKYISIYPPYFENLCPAHKADYIRLRLLFDHGGLWLDSDILCIDSLKPYLDDIERHKLILTCETEVTLVNSFIGSVKGHPFIGEWLRRIEIILKEKKGNIDWCDIGAHVMMSIYRANENGICNGARVYLAYNTFYNIPWQDCKAILLNSPKNDFKKYYKKGQRLLITVNSLYNELKNNSISEILNMKHTILYKYLMKANNNNDLSRHFKMSELNDVNYKPKYKELVENLPPIYYVNLDTDKGRRHRIENTFKKYDITNYTRVAGLDARADKSFFIKSDVNEDKKDERDGEYGCTCSHIKAIREFYENSKANMAIICEDDLDLTAHLEFWDGSFMHMIRHLPWDFECCLLAFSRPKEFGIKVSMQKYELRRHFSTVCYMITREGAKRILDVVNYKNGVYDFTGVRIPAADLFIYNNLSQVYAIPLFSFHCDDSTIHQDHVNSHRQHRENMLEAWRGSVKATQKGDDLQDDMC